MDIKSKLPIRSKLYVYTLLSLFFFKSSSCVLTERITNSITKNSCDKLLNDITTGNYTQLLDVPSNIIGSWTSMKCETRPGPQYVLRKYSFYQGGMFELNQYYYDDWRCSSPAYSLLARGRIVPYQQSWIIDGGHEMDYESWKVNLVTYTIDVAKDFQRRLASANCNTGTSPWQPYQRYSIFEINVNIQQMPQHSDYNLVNLVDDQNSKVDCVHAIDHSLHELQLIRIEQRHYANDDVTKILLLGDINTDVKQRHSYRPMGFQDPMVSTEGPGCNEVCQQLLKSSDIYPPRFRAGPLPSILPPLLPGSNWVSERCEIRPYGTFLTRSLTFSTVGRSYVKQEDHYRDSLCRRPTYSVTISGTYRLLEPISVSPLHDSLSKSKSQTRLGTDGNKAWNDTGVLSSKYSRGRPQSSIQPIDFHVSNINLTGRDDATIELFNHVCIINTNGKQTELTTDGSPRLKTRRSYRGVAPQPGQKWIKDVPVDATTAQGCRGAMVIVPMTEHDVIKVDRHGNKILLFFGQQATNNILGSQASLDDVNDLEYFEEPGIMDFERIKHSDDDDDDAETSAIGREFEEDNDDVDSFDTGSGLRTIAEQFPSTRRSISHNLITRDIKITRAPPTSYQPPLVHCIITSDHSDVLPANESQLNGIKLFTSDKARLDIEKIRKEHQKLIVSLSSGASVGTVSNYIFSLTVCSLLVVETKLYHL